MEALKVDSITKEYPGVLALDNISFSVKEKSIHGFLGPNGAGKSTTMNIITGLIKQTTGSVSFFNEEVDPLERGRIVGFLPENPPVYTNMVVSDYLNFVVKLFSHEGKNEKFKENIINKCGLESVLKRLIGNLSKGFKQRVAIAGAIIHNPKIVILDEPTVGLDPKAIIEIRNLIKELSQDHTILFSSHQLGEVKALCSDITIINNGRIVASDTLEEIENQFVSNHKIICNLQKWNSDIQKDFIDRNLILSAKESIFKDRKNIEILYDSQTTSKSEILTNLVKLNLGVEDFYEEKLELEEVFQKAIEGRE